MLLGLSAALVATICFGVASVLQAWGARSVGAGHGAQGSPTKVILSRAFLLGIVLDIAGFGFSVVALRRLTLFEVQAVTSASLAVTALTAGSLFAVRLRKKDVAALVMVCVGLVLLALGSGSQGRTAVGTGFHVGLLVAATAAVALGLVLVRVGRGPVAMLLGLLAGAGFGLVGLAVRVLDPVSLTAVLVDPAAYTLAVGGLGGYLCYALALQRGAVTPVTAAVIVSETLVPGLIGVVALGDRARAGLTWLAVLGFVLAVAGAFALARFGELTREAGETRETGQAAADDDDRSAAQAQSRTDGVHPGGLERPHA